MRRRIHSKIRLLFGSKELFQFCFHLCFIYDIADTKRIRNFVLQLSSQVIHSDNQVSSETYDRIQVAMLSLDREAILIDNPP